MKTFFHLLVLSSALACNSSPKREIASVKKEPSCMEKTTRKQCTVKPSGQRECVCVPDDSEMYQYP